MGYRELNPNRIAFFGPAASGKTFCATHLVMKHRYEHIAFAGKLKEIARDLFGVIDKNGPNRKILQDIGTKMREIEPDVWINYVLKLADTIHADRKLVLDDLRYINEANALRNHGWTLIQVSARDEIREERLTRLYPETPLSSYYHASEQEWVDIEPDAFVRSNYPDETPIELDYILERIQAVGHV